MGMRKELRSLELLLKLIDLPLYNHLGNQNAYYILVCFVID